MFIVITIAILTLSSCIDEEENSEQKNSKPKVSLSVSQGEEIYAIKTPVKFSIARGTIINNIDNPLDISEIEIGLMVLSMDHFSPNKFYFQEGQYLNKETINSWIARKSKEQEDGLNPSINNSSKNIEDILNEESVKPKILSHVLEQNYLDKDGNIKGISLAISLNEFYYFKVSDDSGLIHSGEVEIDKNKNGINDVKKYGKDIAEEILKRIRTNKDIPDVPIFLTLYQEESRNNVIPGRFLSETFIPQGKNQIEKWNDLDRRYLELPSSDAEKIDKYSSDGFRNLKHEIEKNFMDLDIDIMGRGLYIDKELTEIQIDIETATLSQPQVNALFQYIGGAIKSGIIPNNIIITTNVSGLNKELGIMVWDPVEAVMETHISKK